MGASQLAGRFTPRTAQRCAGRAKHGLFGGLAAEQHLALLTDMQTGNEMTSMQVTRINTLDDCWEIAGAWDCMTHGIPFRRTAWLLSWWNQFQSWGDLYVLQVTDAAGQVVGIAPWFIEQSLRRGRVVRPLGCGDTCSDYLGILTTPEHQQQVTSAITQWMVAAAEGQHGPDDRWDLLDLVSVDPHDAATALLLGQLGSDGIAVHRQNAMSCWRIALPGSWDEYLAMLGRSHRKRVRRIDRKWLESGVTHLRTASTANELSYGMSILIDLHQQRQEFLGNPGCFADPVFTGFMHEAAVRMLHEQTLRLHWMELDGKPIAAEFQLVGGDSTFAYLGGLSNEMEENSPGQIIQVAILKQAIDQQQQVFDFLRGDESYKAHWGVQEYTCHDYRVVPHHHSAQLRHQVWLAGDTMKHWIRTGLHINGTH